MCPWSPAGTMINRVIGGHQIIFCDEGLPFEGMMHNKALHVTIISQEKHIYCVLVDDVCSLNICQLSTLRQSRFDLGNLEKNLVNMSPFDGV